MKTFFFDLVFLGQWHAINIDFLLFHFHSFNCLVETGGRPALAVYVRFLPTDDLIISHRKLLLNN